MGKGKPSSVFEQLRTAVILKEYNEEMENLNMSEESTEKKASETGLCQYADYGGVYIPTSKTVKKLVPGSYKLTLHNRQPALEHFKLISDDLYHLPDSKVDAVIKEIQQFWTLKEKFKHYGFIHKRGFLLHGPPGGGKTSCIMLTAQHMIKEGSIVIMVEDIQLLNAILPSIRKIEPERPILLILEDLDAMVEYGQESSILALLDGESQIDNVVTIATTNYPERLGERLVNRPSRFDKVVHIDMPNDEAREFYFNKKLGFTKMESGEDLVALTRGLGIAHLRDVIVSIFCQGNPVDETIDRLKNMKYTPKSTDGKGKMGFGIGED